MLVLFLATLASTPPLATAERDLVAVAREHGPEVAVRRSMSEEAWLMAPDLQPAAAVLAGKPDYLKADAGAAHWWPSARIVTSCDGSLALATGAGASGEFFTVWERQGADRGWRWVLHGPIAGAAGPAAAGGPPKPIDLTASCGPAPGSPVDPSAEASGTSGDGTLRWWLVRAADREKHRLVIEYLTRSGWKTFEDATVG